MTQHTEERNHFP